MKRYAILMLALIAALGASAQLMNRARQGLLNSNRPGMNRAMGAARGQAAAGNAAEGADAAGRPALTTRDDLRNVPKGTNGVPALAFNQTPLELVLEAYATEVGRTVIPAPDLPKATVTLRSLEGQQLTKEEYLFAIEHVLTMNGVVLEERGEKFLRALARKTVRTQGIPMLMENRGLLPEKGQVVSQMIPFKNIGVTEAQKALEGFKDPNGLFQVFERTNAILVTDTQENINRMLEIAAAIDVATPVLEDVFVRQIKFAVANDIKTALETIVTESQKETQAKETGPKSSGAPGFGSRQPPPMGSRLLNLNNRPGQNQPPPAPTPNETMTAAIDDAARGMIRGKVLILADERSNKLVIITMKSNMDFFDKVIETLDVETEPEFKVEVVRLKFAEAEDVESMLNDLIGGTSSSSSKENKNQNAKTATNTKQTLSGGAKPPAAVGGKKPSANQGSVGDLNKDNCKVLADKRINGIVVMTRKELMPVIMQVIEDMDVKLSQVLIETVIIEVSLGDDLKTGIDWVQNGRHRVTSERQLKNAAGQDLYWVKRTTRLPDGTESTELTETAVPAGYNRNWTTEDGTTYTETASDMGAFEKFTQVVRNNFFNNGSGTLEGAAAGYALGGGGGMGSAASLVASNITQFAGENLGGSGIKYFLKSDKLNLSAIIQASKTDDRTKYLASPIVMTVDNKEAVVEATSSRQFLTGWTSVSGYNGAGMPSPNYSQKDIGITLKMTPKINPNGTIMLTVEEEYSQVSGTQTMLVPQGTTYVDGQIDVPVSRKMTSDVRLENRQTIVLGGLVETYNSDSESGIPILKDIPYIGKWLFGKVTQVEQRKELLVFLTPYVLDDESSAQYEALRRKKAMSDPRPWQDNGWSASPLADPVSKKEQLRRFEDEWKKQDEERKSKLAVEKAKYERAQTLKKMTKAEREEWLKIHKEELEKEEKEAFEKKVEEQKDLQAFVDELKKKDLSEAEGEIKKSETIEKNEYRKDLEKRLEDGKPLPPGETMKKDAAKVLAEKEAEKKANEEAAKKAEADAQAKAAEAKKPQDSASMLEDLKPPAPSSEPKK